MSHFPKTRSLRKPERVAAYSRPSVEQSWRGDAIDPVELVLLVDELTTAEEAVYREEIR